MKRQLRLVSDAGTAPLDASEVHAHDDPEIRVAFATSERRHVDQHFGAALGFAIFAVTPSSHRLLEVAEFARSDMDGHEDKLVDKIEMLAGCAAVYCQAIGASAIGKLLARGVQPIKVSPGASIAVLLEDLKRELDQGSSAWLQRARTPRPLADERRFDRMAAEGWQE